MTNFVEHKGRNGDEGEPFVSRTVLVCVLGTSPQIVTETLYALTRQEGERIDEIHVWTTAAGAVGVQRQLLDGGDGKLFSFFRDYRIPDPWPALHVHVFRDRHGGELGDIRSDEDNAAMLDQLADFVRRQAVPGTRLLCSAAGGRKTMGIGLALALQLYGRPGDRLFHVLVRPDEFESLTDFFYPPPEPVTVVGRSGRLLSTAEAVIELAEVPLVLLREYLPELLGGDEALSYSRLVQEVQLRLIRQARRPPLLIDVAKREVIIDGAAVVLQPVQIALYAHLADLRRRCQHEEGLCPACTVSSQRLREDDAYAAELRASLARWLERIPHRPYRDDALARWVAPDPALRLSALRETASRINRRLKASPAAGRWIQPYLIARRQERDTTMYGLALSPSQISLV